MNRAICFSLVSCFVMAVNAQPAIKDAEIFTAADGSFSVVFPKPPTMSIFPTGVHTAEISPNESYTVMFTDHAAPIVDEFELRFRRAHITKPGAKAIVHQGYSGSEYKGVNVPRKAEDTGRVFIVKQRLFRIEVRTPILRSLPMAQRRVYEKKIAAFFDSFKIGTIPPARFPAVAVMPADLGSLSKENIYTSPYFGFAIRLPTDWKTKGRELVMPNQPSFDTELPANASYWELLQVWNSRNTRKLVRAYREWNALDGEWPVIVIWAQRLEEPFESLQKYVENLTVENSEQKLTSPITEIDLGGQKFLTYELVEKISTDEEPGKTTKHRDFITQLRGIYLTIELRDYKDESDEKLLMEAVKSMRFSERNNN